MSSWITNGNLIGKLSIGQGERGKSLEYNWRGTELGIRVEGEEEYQFVNLAGGGIGSSGADGREIELQVGNGYIQWRYKDEEEWNNLIELSTLEGKQGPQGPKGDIGPQGEKGEQGLPGEKGDQGDNGVFVGDVNEAPESANIVVDECDEGLILFPDMTEFEEEIKKARTDYFGTTHEDLQQRLNNDFDNIHQKVNDSSLLPYEGANITAKDSYYGLIKDLSIKGRTLQNLVQTIDRHTNVTINNDYSFTVNLKAGDTLHYRISIKYGNLIKPGATYTIIYDYETNLQEDGTHYINKIDTYNKYIDIDTSSISGKEKIELKKDGSVSKGAVKLVFKTKNTTNDAYSKAFEIAIINTAPLTQEGAYLKVDNTMILEGDYENTPLSDLPFIEGIKSTGEAEVTEDGKYKVSAKVCGKNLANTSNFVNTTYINAIPYITNYSSVTFPKTLDNNQRGIGCVIKVKPNTTYTMQFDDVSDYLSCGVGYYSNKEDCNNYGKALDRLTHTMVKKNKMTFTTPKGTNYIVASIIALFSHVSAGNTVVIDKIPNFQIEEGTVATDYELYKEQLIEYLLDEPLRSLPNGVSDEIVDGKLIRRVGKKVLNGSENIIASSWNTDLVNTLRFDFGNHFLNSGSRYGISTGIPWYVNEKTGSRVDFPHCSVNVVGNLSISISKSSLTTGDVNEFKKWLTENPVTVCYELAEPIITQLEKHHPVSYEGTTHITSDNTLAPTISCKIPSNVPAIVSSLRLENKELQKENTTLTEKIEANNINNIETSLEQDARLTMLELGVY